MIIPRQKSFSIQSGGPDQGGSLKRELANRAKVGAAAGGVMGGVMGVIPSLQIGLEEESAATGVKLWAGVTAASAMVGAICGALSALGANSRRAKAAGLTMNELLDYLYNFENSSEVRDYKSGSTEVNVSRYLLEDQDPRKFMVNFAYEDGKLVINLNQPTNSIIQDLNENLESMVKYNRKADYAAEPIKNGYMVYVICPSVDDAAGIIYNIIAENHIKVNALTEKSLSKVKQRSFSKTEDKETKYQEKSRKKARRGIISSLGTTGAAIGGLAGLYASGNENRKAFRLGLDHNSNVNMADFNRTLYNTGYTPEEIEAMTKSKEATERAMKALKKKGLWKAGKRTAIGAAAGITVGTILGNSYSKAQKEKNERSNAKRRELKERNQKIEKGA